MLPTQLLLAYRYPRNGLRAKSFDTPKHFDPPEEWNKFAAVLTTSAFDS